VLFTEYNPGMKPTLLAGLLALACAVSLSAAEPADPFAGLKTYKAPVSQEVFLHYDPAVTQLFDKPLVLLEDPTVILRILRTKIDRTQDEWYFVDFDSGPSDDPSFTITREAPNYRRM